MRPFELRDIIPTTTGMASSHEVTELLIEWSEGSQAALDRLMPLIYGELRRIAARYMAAQRPTHTLQTTALIHEAYLRMAGKSGSKWTNRAHFFGVAAKAMRHILVDHARTQSAACRGGSEKQAVTLDETALVSDANCREMLALDDALQALDTLSPRQSQVVELRYFGGLNNEEIAETLKISPETVMRDWRAARAWLYLQLQDPMPSQAKAAP
jgi:RNA polymerase sigma factor (TIGR02999 family)